MTATQTTPKAAAAAPAPPTPEKTSSGYSLPTDLHDEVRKCAAERGFSTSHLVELALRDFLPRLIPVAEVVLVRPAGTPPPVNGAQPWSSSSATTPDER